MCPCAEFSRHNLPASCPLIVVVRRRITRVPIPLPSRKTNTQFMWYLCDSILMAAILGFLSFFHCQALTNIPDVFSPVNRDNIAHSHMHIIIYRAVARVCCLGGGGGSHNYIDRHAGEGSNGSGCPPPLWKFVAYLRRLRCKMVDFLISIHWHLNVIFLP